MSEIVTTDGCRLVYQVDGPIDGHPVLLSNSLGTQMSLWDPLVPALVDNGYRVIRYDSRGHGLSSTPNGPYTLSRLAKDAVSVLDAVEVGKADAIGISLGGMVCLELASTYPQRLKRIVVANSGAKIGDPHAWEQRADDVLIGGLGAIADAVVSGWLTPQAASSKPDQVATMHGWLRANNPEGYAHTCAALALADYRDCLAGITTPTLVIGATDDIPTPPALTAQISKGIPGAVFVEIPGAHLSVQESPKEFSEAVLRHLNHASKN